jgi:hypothetical protein
VQKCKLVANLTWVGFKELFVEQFTPESEELCARIN